MKMNRHVEGKEEKTAPVFGIRHLQCLLLFWGISLAYAMRVNLSLAIVAMTDQKSTNQDFAEYEWTEKEKSLILSSFFSGYMLTQILGGTIAQKFGGKTSVLIGITTSSVLAILTPLSTQLGDWPLLFVVRAIQGMSQGVLFPTSHAILAKWSPKEERAMLATCCYSGAQFGTVIMLAASGYLASSILGWPSIFYISGAFGLVWVLAWHIWGASAPEEYETMTKAERKLIDDSLDKGRDKSQTILPEDFKTPWKEFLSSPPLLALTLTHCAYNWGFWTILTEIPSYMKNILGFNIKDNALLTALPYFVMLVLSFVLAPIAAWIDKRKLLSLTKSRKLFNTISSWIPAMALIGFGYVDADHTEFAVVLLIFAVGLTAAMHMGFQVNHIDLSPNFAGVLLGITSTASNLMGVLAPLCVGFIVSDERDPFQWRLVFFISAGFCFIGNLLFIIYGSAKVQPWNEPSPLANEGAEELRPMKHDTGTNP